METTTRSTSALRVVAAAAIAVGLGVGSYGIASAASGASTTTPSGQLPSLSPSGSQQPAPSQGAPWGGQRSDETLLTGDTAAKVKDAAAARLGSGATVVRVETDADGHAAYEVHATKADGTPITVYVDKSFAVVSVETR